MPSAPATPTQNRFVAHVGISSFCGIVAIVVDPAVVVGPTSPGMTNSVVVGPGFVVGVDDVVVPRARVTVERGRVVAGDVAAVVPGDVVTGGFVSGGDVTGGSVAGGGDVCGGGAVGVVTTCPYAAPPTPHSAIATTATGTARTGRDGTRRRPPGSLTSGRGAGTRECRAWRAAR